MFLTSLWDVRIAISTNAPWRRFWALSASCNIRTWGKPSDQQQIQPLVLLCCKESQQIEPSTKGGTGRWQRSIHHSRACNQDNSRASDKGHPLCSTFQRWGSRFHIFRNILNSRSLEGMTYWHNKGHSIESIPVRKRYVRTAYRNDRLCSLFHIKVAQYIYIYMQQEMDMVTWGVFPRHTVPPTNYKNIKNVTWKKLDVWSQTTRSIG